MGTRTDSWPEALQDYFKMWNEIDPNLMRTYLNKAVALDCIWIDPQHSHIGRDGLEKNVRHFRSNFPDATLDICSNVDSHNKLYRYDWKIKAGNKLLIEGFDVTTLNEEGMIKSVYGFFGRLKPNE